MEWESARKRPPGIYVQKLILIRMKDAFLVHLFGAFISSNVLSTFVYGHKCEKRMNNRVDKTARVIGNKKRRELWGKYKVNGEKGNGKEISKSNYQA